MFEMTVIPDGGEPWQVTATSRDVLRWERMGKNRSLTSLEENLRIQDLYELAYIASKRMNLFSGTPQEFQDTCDIDEFKESEDVDPTRSDLSDEPS